MLSYFENSFLNIDIIYLVIKMKMCESVGHSVIQGYFYIKNLDVQIPNTNKIK